MSIDFFVFNSTFFWEEAILFQQYGYVRVGIYAGTAGEIDFWKKLVSNPQKQKALDDLLVQLGGEPITGKWYWSASQYDVDKAFAWNFEENYPKPLPKHDRCSVRFVAELDYRFN